MSVDYEQLKLFVKEAMFTGGGINEPSAPKGVPHRMPGADGADKQQDLGDPKANKLYSKAVKAREITEEVVEGLDEPIFDAAYEHAFKASASLRKALNAIIESGAHPMPDERVVTPPSNQQRWGGYVPYKGAITYGSDSVEPGAMEEAVGAEGLAPEVRELIEVYVGLPEAEQQAFMAYVMGAAVEK